MSVLQEVTVSGAVGKQVFASTRPVILKQAVLTAPTSAATAEIRDGNASGETKLKIATLVGDSKPVKLDEKGVRFDKGMHVEVIGTDATCYLEID